MRVRMAGRGWLGRILGAHHQKAGINNIASLGPRTGSERLWSDLMTGSEGAMLSEAIDAVF